MDKKLMWRVILIVAVLVLSLVALYPPEKKIHLGLDLRGGSHLVLRVHTEDAVKADLSDSSQRLVSLAKEKGIQLGDVTQEQDLLRFRVKVPGELDREALHEIAATQLPDFKVEVGANEWTFTLPANANKVIRDMAVRQALETIRNRVDEFGVAEPVIQRQGGDSDRIVLQLPGVDDPARVKNIIGKTALLEFREVVSGPAPDKDTLVKAAGGMPPDAEVVPGERSMDGQVVGKEFYLLKRATIITGRELRSARRSQDNFNQPNVLFELVPASATKFADYTGSHIGTRMAIVLDNKVSSAPNIRDRIPGSGVIEGSFTLEEAEDLALVLRAGALPAAIDYLEERTVGPSLGRDSIRAGVLSGIIGLGAIVVFMLVYYRLSGVNAIIALLLNVIILMGAMAYFGATMTLPGIAGVILTIGMAVDANVLIFERIREELRAGKTVRAAVDTGFARALSAIVDSNLTTIISALFLFQFGTGPIKGFAVTLTIGLTASLFTAVFVSRTLYMLLHMGRERVETLSI